MISFAFLYKIGVLFASVLGLAFPKTSPSLRHLSKQKSIPILPVECLGFGLDMDSEMQQAIQMSLRHATVKFKAKKERKPILR
eukprot:UN26684